MGDLEYVIRIMIVAHDRVSTSFNTMAARIRDRLRDMNSHFDRHNSLLGRVRGGWRDLGTEGNRLEGMLNRLTKAARENEFALRGLSTGLRGLIIAAAIKWAQPLLTAVVALGGGLVELAGSATLAAEALGVGLTTAVAQAIPAIVLMVGAVHRLSLVFKAVQLATQNQITSAEQHRQQTERIRSATSSLAGAQDGLRSAMESVTNAQDRQRDAQIALTDARRQAVRQIQDLIFAEKEARLAAEGAALTQAEAQRRLQEQIASGASAADIARAQLDVRSATLGREEAVVRARRARADASRAAAGGVTGQPAVIAANKQLVDSTKAIADAQRGVARAESSLADAHRQLTQATTQATGQQLALNQALAQLDPAERKLFETLRRAQAVWKQAFRPITDEITNAFRFGVERGIVIMRDRRNMSAMQELGDAIAQGMRHIFRQLSTPEMQGVMRDITRDAAKNIPLLADALGKFATGLLRLARAGQPIFREILEWFDRLGTRFDKWSRNTKAVREFLETAKNNLAAWGHLAGAIIRLWQALAGGSAKEGKSLVESIADALDRWADWINKHPERFRKFLSDTNKVLGSIWEVITALFGAFAAVFDPKTMDALTGVLSDVLLPALRDTVIIMGFVLRVIHQLISLPFVRDIGRWVFTIGLLTMGMVMVKAALTDLAVAMITFATRNPVLALFSALAVIAFTLQKQFHNLGITVGVLSVALVGLGVLLKAMGLQMRLVFFANPYVAAVMAIITVLLLLEDKFHIISKTLEWFRDHWKDIFNAIWAFMKGYFTGLADAFKGLFTGIINFFDDIFHGRFVAAFKGLFNTIRDLLIKNNPIVRGFKSLWEAIGIDARIGIEKALNVVIGWVNKVIDGINWVITKVGIPAIPHVPKAGVETRPAGAATSAAHTGAAMGAADGGLMVPSYDSGGIVRPVPGGVYRVAEAGAPEMVIPLDPNKRRRALELVKTTHMALGLQSLAAGGIAVPVGALQGPPDVARFLWDELSMAKRMGLRLTSGYRPGAVTDRKGTPSDHSHFPSWAIDVADGAAAMARFFRSLIGRKEISQAFYDPIGSIFGGKLSTYREGGHSDHVHVAQHPTGGSGDMLVEAFNSVAGLIGKGLHIAASEIANHIPKVPKVGGVIGDMAAAARDKIVDRLKDLVGGIFTGPADWLLGKQTDYSFLDAEDLHKLGALPRGGHSPGGAKIIAREMLGRMGWNQYWGALENLWQGESGFKWNALNSKSGAYGIPQALPATKMRAAGADWKTNAYTQMLWGLGYIRGEYHDPANAYTQWLARDPHWYGDGGAFIADGPVVAGFGEDGAELVTATPVADFQDGGIAFSPTTQMDIPYILRLIAQLGNIMKQPIAVLTRLLTSLHDQLGKLADAVAARAEERALARRQKITSMGPGGEITTITDEATLAAMELADLREGYADLLDARSVYRTALEKINEELARTNDPKRREQLLAQAAELSQLLRDNAEAIQSNIESQAEAQERINQAAQDAYDAQVTAVQTSLDLQLQVADIMQAYADLADWSGREPTVQEKIAQLQQQAGMIRGAIASLAGMPGVMAGLPAGVGGVLSGLGIFGGSYGGSFGGGVGGTSTGGGGVSSKYAGTYQGALQWGPGVSENLAKYGFSTDQVTGYVNAELARRGWGMYSSPGGLEPPRVVRDGEVFQDSGGYYVYVKVGTPQGNSTEKIYIGAPGVGYMGSGTSGTTSGTRTVTTTAPTTTITKSVTGGNRWWLPAQQGRRLRSKRGGTLVLAGEAGFDEYILTTDPRYRDRTMGLLEQFLVQTSGFGRPIRTGMEKLKRGIGGIIQAAGGVYIPYDEFGLEANAPAQIQVGSPGPTTTTTTTTTTTPPPPSAPPSSDSAIAALLALLMQLLGIEKQIHDMQVHMAILMANDVQTNSQAYLAMYQSARSLATMKQDTAGVRRALEEERAVLVNELAQFQNIMATYGATMPELDRVDLQTRINNLQVQIIENKRTIDDLMGLSDASIQAMLGVRMGFFRDLAPNIFSPGPQGLESGSSQLKDVVVNQYFLQQPSDPFTWMRRSAFAARTAFS